MFLAYILALVGFVTVKSQDFTDKMFCEEFDDDRVDCLNQGGDCVFVSLNSTTSEQVCVPDNCGQFVNDETGCNNEANCIWQDDPNTNITLFRCFPS